MTAVDAARQRTGIDQRRSASRTDRPYGSLDVTRSPARLVAVRAYTQVGDGIGRSVAPAHRAGPVVLTERSQQWQPPGPSAASTPDLLTAAPRLTRASGAPLRTGTRLTGSLERGGAPRRWGPWGC